MVDLAVLATNADNINKIVGAAGTVAGFLGTGISYLRGFVPWSIPWPGKKVETIAVDDIETFRKKLCREKVREKPQRITAQGTFFRSVLLSSGGWEREHEAGLPDFNLKTGLQTWLYRGFEEWAPSWDFNPLSEKEPIPYFFGQIGTRDEANSLPVIVPGAKGKMLRENLGDNVVLQSTVTGLLYHRSKLPPPLSTKLGRYGKAFDYCILLDEEDGQHGVSVNLDKTKRQYSGYLWQCWGPDPQKWLSDMTTPRFDEVYFLWEHTDLTKPDAVEYNLDSLHHKAEYILKRNPGFVLLQKSSSVVPGTPKCPSGLFYHYILQKEEPT